MKTPANDHRVRVTKMLIRRAFTDLLKQKPLQSITIKELCAAAGINRGTFYAHYTDIYDLLAKIEEEMFEDSSLHDPKGAYQSIFGLDVVKEYRCQGVAAALMEAMIKRAKEQGRKGLILTCKDRLIHYYEKFGYVNMGVSRSVHGGAVWYDMILEFNT